METTFVWVRDPALKTYMLEIGSHMHRIDMLFACVENVVRLAFPMTA